ncbi:glycoside hydrolase superfamily [Mycena metata]|uniref:beta-mannosidase n=1 Tax=Mycena metata TaxID=1033252 RepID=A0AAD7IFC3_9AGAR|nr:glycoside hydrolase superfamily [Mycena metata]
MSRAHNLELNTNWSWKQREPAVESVLDEVDGWKPAQAYPSEIHVELLKSGAIPDPYLGFNENKVQWISKAEWLYKCTFDFTADAVDDHALLEFLGLDTICDVYLNGAKILAADNMFQMHVVPLELSSLKQQNTLLLHFKSALLLAKELEAQMGVVRAGSTNLGDPSRVYVRKAQYDWRWDWGPELMTCGPYRPITLKTYTARIKDVQAHALLSAANTPSLTVDVALDGSPPARSSLRITLASLDGKVLKTADVPASTSVIGGAVSWDLSGVVEPWWPVGYGAQALYNLSVSLIYISASSSQQDGAESVLDENTTRVGFRRVALVQEPLAEADQYGTGTTFLFEVNGVRMFMGGSNWVPADNLLTTISPERYRAWLTILRDGNQNMVRLWGGGVYEPDVFYDTCDELGILVWQDFQFACGVYPAHDSFVASVRKEAEDNVRRLRHHPSLALFCGNNEDYQMVLQWGDVKDFPAIKIYEEVLPDVVSALTGPHAPIPYHRGSPYGGKGWDTADPTVGDVHQWNVWGGKEFPWQDYVKLGGRFVSEFGIPSHPEMKTIEYWMDGADAEARHAQSALMAQHCRAGSFERRLAILMNEGFKVTEDLETYVYNTRLMAAEAVGYAYQVWRRKWGGRGKEYTAGVLVWQLNDCWPVTSWAIADYFLRPKPIYFTIKRQLETYSVGIMRTVIKNRANDRPPQYYEYGNFQSYGATLEIWGTNSSLTPRAATLELHCIDLKSRWTHTETHAVTLLPNQATELLALPCPGPPQDVAAAPPTGDAQFTSTHSVVVGARLLDGHGETGKVLARYADWPQPYRFIEPALLSQPGLDVQVDRATGEVRASVERPVKGLWLSATSDDGKEGKEEAKWSDNALDVMPGDPQVVFVKGLGGRKVEVSWLGREKVQTL